MVAPYAGAWIETLILRQFALGLMSLLMRERGLKLGAVAGMVGAAPVAPYAGAWIETTDCLSSFSSSSVAPYAGAWIETSFQGTHPKNTLVAPYAGAWIETKNQLVAVRLVGCRSLCGSVD